MTAAATSSRGDWLRSRPSRALLGVALLMCLVLGAGVVAVSGSPEPTGEPLSDEAAVAQVVSAAREIVATAQLHQAAGGYSFQSCAGGDDPPYQAALYATFAVPQQNPARYLQEAAAAVSADGWTRSPAVGEHFGIKLARDGLTALLDREGADTGFAALRLYGECRNDGDHRDDDPAWTEVGL
jgi:hypothetical protein